MIEGIKTPDNSQLSEGSQKSAGPQMPGGRPITEAFTDASDLRVLPGHDASLVEVRLLTGFKHQIRAQLANIGHPIIGDRFYGGPPAPAGEAAIGLWAWRLALDHPVTRERQAFEAQPPSTWPFNLIDRQ